MKDLVDHLSAFLSHTERACPSERLMLEHQWSILPPVASPNPVSVDQTFLPQKLFDWLVFHISYRWLPLWAFRRHRPYFSRSQEVKLENAGLNLISIQSGKAQLTNDNIVPTMLIGLVNSFQETPTANDCDPTSLSWLRTSVSAMYFSINRKRCSGTVGVLGPRNSWTRFW